MKNSAEIIIHIQPGTVTLPDNNQWTNRFEIHSSTSNKIYTIAQNKTGRWWGCSCFGWKRHKHCHHLKEIGLPGNYVPCEARLPKGNQ